MWISFLDAINKVHLLMTLMTLTIFFPPQISIHGYEAPPPGCTVACQVECLENE